MADIWKPLPDAPRDKPVLLFLPAGWWKHDRDGRVVEAEHAKVVGWWSESDAAWVTGVHPKGAIVSVYPSLWADLPDDPVLP